MKRCCRFLVLFALLLAACTPATLQPTLNATTLPPTASAVPSPSPSATVTPTQSITQTPRPTATADGATPRPTAPGEAKFTKFPWYRGNSPDLKWFWMVEEEPGKDYFITHLVNADGTLEWFVHPENVKSGWQNINYQPYFWLPKEPYIFLTGHGCCVEGNTHYTQLSLARLNLETGQLSIILPWGYGFTAYSIGFSPGGRYLVWSEIGQHSVHVKEISSGKEQEAVLNAQYRDIGGKWDHPLEGWSPDLTRVIQEIYMDCGPSNNDSTCYRVAFVIIETATGGFQVIDNPVTRSIGTDNQWDYQIGWMDENHVRLFVGGKPYVYPVDIPAPVP